MRESLTLILSYLYAFLSVLGNLTRFGADESSLGVTTLILVFIVILNLKTSFNLVFKNNIYVLFSSLCLWWLFTSIFSFNIMQSYIQLAQFIFYPLFSAAIYNLNWSKSRIKNVLLFFMIGAFVSSSLTIVDFFNVIDIPGVNDTLSGKITGDGVVLQANGPFFRRSAMAAFFSIVIPFCAFIVIRNGGSNTLVQFLAICTLILTVISLMITGNRAAILSSFLSIVIISLVMSNSKVKLFKQFVIFTSFILLIFSFLSAYLPDQVLVYKELFGFAYSYDGENISKSDEIRTLLFLHVLKSLIQNPLGHGFSNIYGFYGNDDADPHNLITQILWASGVIGFFWIAVFIKVFYSKLKLVFIESDFSDTKLKDLLIILFAGILSWFFCGMTHMILATGAIWLFFGVFLRAIKNYQINLHN
jgi:hypothetical protein